MALITCSECGKQFSDTVAQCPHCGYDPKAQQVVCPECGHQYNSELAACPNCGFMIHKTNKITIHGHNEVFLGNPPVKIFIEGRQVGMVERGGTTAIEIDHDCVIDFRWMYHKTSLAVKVGQKEQIMLSVNRNTGSLIASTTTEEKYAQDSTNVKAKDKSRIIKWIIYFAILFSLIWIVFPLIFDKR